MRQPRLPALAVTVVALLARMGVVVWAGARFPPVEDGHYYDLLARRLASGQGYTWLWPDGAVTFAAHYPVGYPAILATAYTLFGSAVGVAMCANAVVGAAGAYGVYRLVDGEGVAWWRPMVAGLAMALHPALVPYTAAVMTEGVTASLLVLAAALAVTARTRARPWPWLVSTGVVLALSTLVRPQCFALAPVLGVFAVPAHAEARSRIATAAGVSLVVLACLLPWSARNCERMNRCALVSMNGGWNLLIGATTQTGAWQPMPVPVECETVWDEAGKDSCFEKAAWRAIDRAPRQWMLHAPEKLAATFDYFGAAPWYLHASNEAAFGERMKAWLGALETVASRLLLLAALATCGAMEGPRRRWRFGFAWVGAVSAVTLHGWVGYLVIPALVGLMGWRVWARAPAVVPITAALIVATAATHAIFFGAGRYGLVVTPFVTALAFVGRALPPGTGEGSLAQARER